MSNLVGTYTDSAVIGVAMEVITPPWHISVGSPCHPQKCKHLQEIQNAIKVV